MERNPQPKLLGNAWLKMTKMHEENKKKKKKEKRICTIVKITLKWVFDSSFVYPSRWVLKIGTGLRKKNQARIDISDA